VRNCIYEFVAIGDDEPIRICKSTGGPGTYAALSRVCKEIRAEYRPIQRREAHIEVNWDDLPRFQDVFMGSPEDRANPPCTLRVAMGSVDDDTPSVDILPLLLLQYFHPTFDCIFLKQGDGHGLQREESPSWEQEELQDRPECGEWKDEWTCLNDLLSHDNAHWRSDVQTGRFASIVVARRYSACVNFVPGREPDRFAVWLASLETDPRQHQEVYDRTRERWGFEEDAFIAYYMGLELKTATSLGRKA